MAKSCYFYRKALSQMLLWALNTPLYLIWLTFQNICVSTKKVVPGLAHKKYFKKQKLVKKCINKTQQTYFIQLTYQIRSDK